MKIELTDENYKHFLNYESDFVPQNGDIVAGSYFKDNEQRKVKRRLIIPELPNKVVVIMELSYPPKLN